MESVTSLDLAANCAELVGTTGSLAVRLNRLLRVYRNTPTELRQLQAQVALGKQTLDRLLPLLDRDQPAFQHAQDLEALGLHFKALVYVIGDIQSGVSMVEQARASPFLEWATVQQLWEVKAVSGSALRMGRQLAGLEVYLKVTRPESEAQQLVEITDSEDRACLIAAWDDVVDEMAPANKESPTAVPEISIDGSYSTAHPGASRDSSPVARNSHGSQSSPSTNCGTMVPYAASAKSSSTRQSLPSYPVLSTAMAQLDVGRHRRNSYWRDAIKQQAFNIPSARKIKSVAMMQKAPTESTPIGGMTGDDLYPAEFKSRASGYARGISPSWELKTVPARKNETKQRFRHRFTRDSADNLSPEKLQSQFKVTEKELWDAILNREVDKVAKIMEHRFSDNLIVEKRDRLTALHLAASLGLCSIVQILVSLGASPNHPDRYGVSALHYAADFGCAHCLQILALGNGKTDIDSPKTHVRTPLFYAARSGKTDAVHALLGLGAHVYTLNTAPQETVLYAAVESGNIDVCEAVLNKGANPRESFATLALAAATSRNILRLLVDAGADVDSHDDNHETLLMKYLLESDVAMVSLLIGLGAKPESTTDQFGRSHLHLALDKGGLPDAAALVALLLAAGHNPDVRNSLGQTPLHLAVLWARADAAEVLCANGAGLHVADSKGVTSLEETQMLGYGRRAGASTLADFPGTKAVLERWQQGSRPRMAEVHGTTRAVPEIDGRLPSKPRPELGNTLKPTHALHASKSLVELRDLRRSVHEMDARPHSIARKPVIAELPAN